MLLAKKFYAYKQSEKRDYFFGRDVPDTESGRDTLYHVHIAPSSNAQEWIDQFYAKKPNDFYRVSDRIMLYAQYKLLNRPTEYLVIDFFHDPGGHKRLREYIGDVHSDFAFLKTLPEGYTCLIPPVDNAKIA